MRKTGMFAVAAIGLMVAGVAHAAPAPIAARDKATYFPNSDLQNVWKDLEAKQALNKRVLEGGAYSINIRIVKPTDPPLLHAASLDIWLVSEGSATAVTGGKLLNLQKRPNNDDAAGSAIEGGT